MYSLPHMILLYLATTFLHQCVLHENKHTKKIDIDIYNSYNPSLLTDRVALLLCVAILKQEIVEHTLTNSKQNQWFTLIITVSIIIKVN